ncbi:hypothetical protein [Micromonospora sp. CB01531]|uniref:hypothetical protein n=1 Tax=Micromonospora sp. CB01531 TaxID=1718947 RepID=UPI00093DCE9A|nr:hypothetical protein [Micromonospora sp. CB01531]OKI42289.1 hypothetical protein A6A27_13310 [Micromonospora sp. CB01531]
MPGRQFGLTRPATSRPGDAPARAHISKIGSVELRQAIIALDVRITLRHPDFAASMRRLIGAG